MGRTSPQMLPATHFPDEDTEANRCGHNISRIPSFIPVVYTMSSIATWNRQLSAVYTRALGSLRFTDKKRSVAMRDTHPKLHSQWVSGRGGIGIRPGYGRSHCPPSLSKVHSDPPLLRASRSICLLNDMYSCAFLFKSKIFKEPASTALAAVASLLENSLRRK